MSSVLPCINPSGTEDRVERRGKAAGPARGQTATGPRPRPTRLGQRRSVAASPCPWESADKAPLSAVSSDLASPTGHATPHRACVDESAEARDGSTRSAERRADSRAAGRHCPSSSPPSGASTAPDRSQGSRRSAKSTAQCNESVRESGNERSAISGAVHAPGEPRRPADGRLACGLLATLPGQALKVLGQHPIQRDFIRPENARENVNDRVFSAPGRSGIRLPGCENKDKATALLAPWSSFH